MAKLSLNNLSLSDHDPSIPKARRKALEMEDRRKSQSDRKKNAYRLVQATALAVKQLNDNQILSNFTPGMRIITRDDGVGAGEVLTIWEVVRQEGGNLVLRMIYEDNGGLYGSRLQEEQYVNIGWLKENLLAVSVFGATGLPLIPFYQESNLIVPSTMSGMNSVLVNQLHYRPRFHEKSITDLSQLFLKGDPKSLIGEITDTKIAVSAIPYELHFDIDCNMVSGSAFGDGFWFSLQYEYVLQEIVKKFFGKQVKILYRGITYNSQQPDQSIEYVQDPIVGTVGSIESGGNARPLGYKVVLLLNARQLSKEVTSIPREAFYTGFTIEIIQED